MGSAAPAAKAALFARCQALFTGVQVSYGHPGTARADDIVAVGNIESEQTYGPMARQIRPRDERFTVTVVISVYRGGGPEVQQVATERAYALAALLEADLQTGDPTLGGAVRTTQVVGHQLEEPWDNDDIKTGRTATLAVAIACEARI